MRNDLLSGDWAANRHHLDTGVDKLPGRIAKAIGEAFDALTRQQFDAPWRCRRPRVRVEGKR